MKRRFSSLFALAMAAMLLAGIAVGGQALAESDLLAALPSPPATYDGILGELGFGNGATLSFSGFEGWYSAVSMNDNLDLWKAIEEKTGVKIEWHCYADYDNTVNPMIAAGQQLPDIMMVTPTYSNSGVFELGRDGIIIPLEDLINQYAPDIKKYLDENPDIKSIITAPDGVIYALPDISKGSNDIAFMNSLMIRQDWLDALKLPVPVTLDDWHTVLTAFKENDMAGNGTTIPFSGFFGDSSSALQVFYPAFGLPVGATDWWYDKDGKAFNIRTTPEFKEFLKVMSQWYAEGLIDMEKARDESAYQAFIATGVSGTVVHLSQYIDNYTNLVSSAVPGASYTLVDHPKGPDGTAKIVKRSATSNCYGITKDCKDPVMAIKWINFLFSDMGITCNQWGLEGVTYEMVNGRPQYTDYVLHNPDGLSPVNALRKLGVANNVFSITTAEASLARRTLGAEKPFIVRNMQNLVEPWPPIMLLKEEQDIVKMYNTDYATYRDEMYGKFIRGEESLDNFDSYVKTMNDIGMGEILKVKQLQLDRGKMGK